MSGGAASSGSRELSASIMAFINSPTGPKTTHFWGPVANWGLVGSAILDIGKSPENISLNMTGVLSLYSLVFMRFFWMVQPRNYFGLGTHVCNEAAQLTQLTRKLQYDWAKEAEEKASKTVDKKIE